MSDRNIEFVSANTGVIGACWYLEPKRFLAYTDRFLKKSLGGSALERRFVAMKGTPTSCEGCVHVDSEWLTGNGAFLDISAYSSASATLPDTLPMYMIFNDTLFSRHPWRLIAHRLASVRESLVAFPAPAVAAEIHPSTDLLLVDPHNATRRHLSTFCLLLNNSGFQLLRRLLSQLPVSGDAEVVKAWIDDRVAAYPALASLLHVHLFGPRTPWSWKQNHAPLLYRKAVTVIFEYLFTVELLAGGMGMPINYGLEYRLRSKLGRHG